MSERVRVNIWREDSEWEITSVMMDAITYYHGTDAGHNGHPDITHYKVIIGEHELNGTWDGDARHDTEVNILESHPLARSILATRSAKV